MSDQTIIKRAWRWSALHSPLLGLWRWSANIGRPDRRAAELIHGAHLPGPVAGLILTTVHRTKLWASEREQVARELIAHAQDALDAGHSDDEIITSFGKPRVVARLMRRSMKRKRPLAWQAYRFSRRAVGVMMVLLIVGYGALAARFYMGKPTIRRNYIAELKARNDAYREDQKSWAVLAEVGHQWDLKSYALNNDQRERIMTSDRPNRSAGMYLFPDVDPDHPDFDEIADAVRGLAPQLSRLREAAARPIVGTPIGYEAETVEVGGRSWTVDMAPAIEQDYIEHSVIEVLLPDLGWSRKLSQVLVFDARLAMAEGDPQRAADDLIACMGLARQCNQQPFMISRLVGIAIQDMVGVRLNQLFLKHPGAFTRDQLIALAHTNALLNREWGIGLENERMSFRDMLQRVYTDDGDGNGHLTDAGLQTIEPFIGGFTPWGLSDLGEVLFEEKSVRAAAMPLVLARSDDRNTERRRHEAFINDLERILAEGPRSIGRLALSKAKIQQHRAGRSVIRFSLMDVMTPAITRTVERSFQNKQTGAAIGVMLAVELYRVDHDRLPDSLRRLVPEYLPAVPDDIMDTGQPLKYVHDTSGSYVLYSMGSDGDDDGGFEPDPAPNERMELGRRYRMQIVWVNGKPHIERDAQGNLKQLSPAGPDSDWILIDMRPKRD